jgi:hypothetical protein
MSLKHRIKKLEKIVSQRSLKPVSLSKYLLFGSGGHNAAGGALDLIHDSEDPFYLIDKFLPESGCDWWHILDTDERMIVAGSDVQSSNSVKLSELPNPGGILLYEKGKEDGKTVWKRIK